MFTFTSEPGGECKSQVRVREVVGWSGEEGEGEGDGWMDWRMLGLGVGVGAGMGHSMKKCIEDRASEDCG